MQKSCSADKSTMYVDNIRQSSERMREMLNTLLDFFRLDNGKEQPNLSPCRISAITHILGQCKNLRGKFINCYLCLQIHSLWN